MQNNEQYIIHVCLTHWLDDLTCLGRTLFVMCSTASWACFNLFLGFHANGASNTREKRPLLAGNFSACTPWQTYYLAKHYLAVKQHSFRPILLCYLFIYLSATKIDFVSTTRLVQTLDILWGSRSMEISILGLSAGMFWSRTQQRP